MEFVPYPKTPRLKRDTVITEKLDGTNAQVVIKRLPDDEAIPTDTPIVAVQGNLLMYVGSRSRWITPGKTTDNYGFAQWCLENSDELFKLGEGQHFGEWYGQGIQRGYGLDHRRFALFNTARWGAHNPNTPACCETVPVLYTGHMTEVDAVMKDLVAGGSVAVPGFMKPEGVIVYHSVSKQVYKVLVENDDKHKGEGA
jgi:hypothetical protein